EERASGPGVDVHLEHVHRPQVQGRSGHRGESHAQGIICNPSLGHRTGSVVLTGVS
ncbi:MAG: hypothetical protein HKN62_04630, partial [Phycisphaerales bacterium]|nr:hypothetical protein [Phycisphaerales bacterium]